MIASHTQSGEIFREIGDRLGEGSSLGNPGKVYNFLGQYEQAINFHQQLLEIVREIGDRLGKAHSRFNLGLVLAKLKRKSEAITACQNARELYLSMGLDANVQNCDNAIQRLAKKSNRLVALLRAVTEFFLRLRRLIHARIQRQR